MPLLFLKALVATLILVWQLADGRFIVTADSREVNVRRMATIFDNNACKLHVLSPSVVFFETDYSKATAYGRVVFDGVAIARDVIMSHSHEQLTSVTVDSFADEWTKKMEAGFHTYIDQYPQLPRPPGGSLGVFLVSLSDGSTHGAIASLDYIDGQLIVDKPKPVIRGFNGFGDHDGNKLALETFNERHLNTTLPTDPALALYRLEDDTTKELNAPGVGGLTDEVVLSPGHIPFWAHRKPECPEKEN